MIKNKAYYKFFASYTVPNDKEVVYWIDLGADAKGRVIKVLNENTNQWLKLTDSTSDDAVSPFVGSNGNWWVDNRDTGIHASGYAPKIGDNGNWWLYNGLTKKYEDTGVASLGRSAYELAVKNGYEGTEKEWLQSLKQASEDAAKVALEAADKVTDIATSINSSIDEINKTLDTHAGDISAANKSIKDTNGNLDTTNSNVTAVTNDLKTHTSNTTIHVTNEDKNNWNNKTDQDTFNGLSQTVSGISTSVEGLTTNVGNLTSTVNNHTGNSDIHITSAERTKWNATTDSYNTFMGEDTDNVINKWNEVAKFLADYTEADDLATLLSKKVDKVDGYSLTKNDFTDTYKSNLEAAVTKLAGIDAGANKYVHPTQTAISKTNSNGTVLSAIEVNTLGHVTSVGTKTLAEADIPSLSISKITNLQTSLDNKANATDLSKYLPLDGGTMTGDIDSIEDLFTIKNSGGILELYGATSIHLVTISNSASNSKAGSAIMDGAGFRPFKASTDYLDIGASTATWKDGYFSGTIYADTFSGTLSGNATTATTASKVANALTVGSKTYDGSSAVSITTSDLDIATPDLTGYATEAWVLGKNYLTSHQDISGKADKATTLAGYGITDAKIANGVITLGSNTITPLTSHQDISGKADKATTIAGYGITDAKISNGVITLGTNTITPLTSHQSLTDYLKKTDISDWAKASTKPSYSWSEITSKPTFATVATSGSYTDLSNKPTIPTALPNPYALAFGTKSYDGGASMEITASDLGAATTSDLAKYLPLTGGTMTGDITLSESVKISSTGYAVISGASAVGLLFNGKESNGVILTSGSLRPYSSANGLLDIGTSAYKFKDAYFSGTVNATTFNGNLTGIANSSYRITARHGANLTSSTYTVADIKTKLLESIEIGYTVGDATLLPSVAVKNWSNDSTTMAAGSTYTAIRISAGYDDPSKYAQWILGHFSDNKIGVMGINNGRWTSVRWLAYEDGTVEKANKLATARTIWGQSFDGSADVSEYARMPYMYFSDDGITNSGIIGKISSSSDNLYFNSYKAASLIFGTNNAPRMTIDDSGNVGIGTSSPAYKLDVNGTGRFTGALATAGTLTASGQAALDGGAVIPSDKTFKIGDCTLSYDSTNDCLVVNKTIKSSGDIVALS